MSVSPDLKMSTEDALNATDKLLKNVAENLERFLGGLGESKSASEKTGLYPRYGVMSSSTGLSAADKQKQYAENLILVNGAQQDVVETMEERVRSTRSLQQAP
jgi:hypothetical protein